jgi:hypothetical protein
MATATPATWLFRKEHETIWIVRAEAYLLLVFGPGSVRRQYRFGGDAEMQLFQVTLTQNLNSTGWVLWSTDRDRRRGERRAAARNSPDRRMPAEPPDTSAGPQRVQV